MRKSLFLVLVIGFIVVAMGADEWCDNDMTLSPDANGMWNDPDTWTGEMYSFIPGPSTNVTIDSFNVTVEAPAEARKITVTAGSVLTVKAGQTLTIRAASYDGCDDTGCASDPCNSNGNCIEVSETLYYCDCDTGFDGVGCENTASENTACDSNPCGSGETCNATTADAYTCIQAVDDTIDELEIVLDSVSFDDGTNVTAFFLELPNYLANDIGGSDADDFIITYEEENDGTYTIIITYTNDEGYSADDVTEAIQSDDSEINANTAGFAITVQSTNEETEEDTGGEMLIIYVAAGAIALILGGVGAYMYLNKSNGKVYHMPA